MENSAPYEILAGPIEAYVAPVGTAFPEVDEAPGGAWTLIGSNGSRNYDEGGVTVQHGQEIEKWKGLGSVGAVKAFRTGESLMVTFTLVDLSLEQYSAAMNFNAIDTVVAALGTPGTKEIGLSRGRSVARRALLLRGASPYGDDMVAQYQIGIAIEEGSPEPAFVKGEPAGLELQFSALEDPDEDDETLKFGKLVTQTAPAIT